MEYLVGLTLALLVSLGGTAVGLDRDRGFYTALALAVGTYYLVFAVAGGSTEALMKEVAAYAVLATTAVLGFRTSLWLVVVALVGHGVFDLFHDDFISNEGVPSYWPMFCMTYDVAAGLYLALLLYRRPSNPQSAAAMKTIAAYVRHELDAATSEVTPADSFRRLERAHVLSQVSTVAHVRVHWHMLVWGIRQGDVREVVGQILRIAGALIKTALGMVPLGNTGGANVSPFKPMPVPEDLAAILGTHNRAAMQERLPGEAIPSELHP